MRTHARAHHPCTTRTKHTLGAWNIRAAAAAGQHTNLAVFEGMGALERALRVSREAEVGTLGARRHRCEHKHCTRHHLGHFAVGIIIVRYFGLGVVGRVRRRRARAVRSTEAQRRQGRGLAESDASRVLADRRPPAARGGGGVFDAGAAPDVAAGGATNAAGDRGRARWAFVDGCCRSGGARKAQEEGCRSQPTPRVVARAAAGRR